MVEDIFSFHEIKKKPDQRKKIDEIYRISTIEKIKKLTNKSKILKNNYCDCFFHNDSIDHGFGDKICSYHKNEQEIKDLKYILNVYDLDLHREKRKEKQRAIIEIEKEIFHKKLSFITIFLIFSFMIILGFFSSKIKKHRSWCFLNDFLFRYLLDSLVNLSHCFLNRKKHFSIP